MALNDPLSRLNALDVGLERGLRLAPTLLQTIEERFKDAVPSPLGTVPLDQLYLDEAPLTHRLCAATLGLALPDAPVQQLTTGGLIPISEQENHWVRRFLERTGNDLLQLHLDGLKRFWAFTLIDQLPACQWLKQLYRDQLWAQAQLRHADATLEPPALALMEGLTQPDTAPASRPWQGAIILHSGNVRWALPGAFVLCQRDPHQAPPIPVLLSTLTHGLEAFDSLDSLYQELAERLEDDRQGPALLAALDAEGQDLALRCDALTFEAVPGDLFDFLQTSVERRQQAAVSQAWDNACKQFELRDLDAASEALSAAAALGQLLSSQGPRLTRYAHLLERNMPAWMVGLSQAQRLELIVAMRELGLATASAIAPGLPSPKQFANPQWLRQYVREELTTLLRELGISLPPDRVLVSVTSAVATGPIVN